MTIPPLSIPPFTPSSLSDNIEIDASSPSSASSSDEEKQTAAHANNKKMIPQYLQDIYYWFYINPISIRVLDCQRIVNAILWGNYNMLRTVALDELASSPNSTSSAFSNHLNAEIQGRTLQVACAYGDFTESLLQRMDNDTSNFTSLDVIDVVPAQIDNLIQKLNNSTILNDDNNNNDENNKKEVTVSCQNADNLIGYDDNTFDQVVFFFLLHEIPTDVRINILREAYRVVKRKGGKLIFVDYHKPNSPIHRFILSIVFYLFEPYAKDIWYNEIHDWFHPAQQESPQQEANCSSSSSSSSNSHSIHKEVYCNGLYQKVVIVKK